MLILKLLFKTNSGLKNPLSTFPNLLSLGWEPICKTASLPAWHVHFYVVQSLHVWTDCTTAVLMWPSLIPYEWLCLWGSEILMCGVLFSHWGCFQTLNLSHKIWEGDVLSDQRTITVIDPDYMYCTCGKCSQTVVVSLLTEGESLHGQMLLHTKKRSGLFLPWHSGFKIMK